MGISVGSSIYNAPSIYESGAGGGGGGGLQPNQIVIGNQVLDTVEINDQIWTTKNFDSVLDGIIYNAAGEWLNGPYCWYYQKNPSSYGVYGEDRGMLYSYQTQSIIQSWLDVNLNGWRIPTKDDWNKLINFAGGQNLNSLHKLGKPYLWSDPSLFTDDLNLSLIPTGRKSSDQFNALESGFFWSSTTLNLSSIIYCCCNEVDGINTAFTLSSSYSAAAYRFVKDV